MKKTALVLLLVSAAAGLLQAQSNYTPMVTLRRPFGEYWCQGRF